MRRGLSDGGIGVEPGIFFHVHAAARPFDGDALYLRATAQAEVEAGVVG